MKSSVHYALIDGGALTAPDNAVFDPLNGIGETIAVPADSGDVLITRPTPAERPLLIPLGDIDGGGAADYIISVEETVNQFFFRIFLFLVCILGEDDIGHRVELRLLLRRLFFWHDPI